MSGAGTALAVSMVTHFVCGWCWTGNLLPIVCPPPSPSLPPTPTHRLDPNHERAAFIMQKLLHREKDPDGGGRRVAMRRRAEEDRDLDEEENMAEGMDDVLAAPFQDGLDQHESLQQQLYHVS